MWAEEEGEPLDCAICQYAKADLLPADCATGYIADKQTIKSRLQSAPHGTYTGFMDCGRKLVAADGVTALWKGFGPAMARAFPANVRNPPPQDLY